MDLDHRRGSGASAVLTCVIICLNVPYLVGAHLYNNRYAGDQVFRITPATDVEAGDKGLRSSPELIWK
ncbi:hypothetical protein CHARACLAT_025076 [Characodon lateralis]|uniref:Uncharacterized protein n=1 Tax=Characodon lateralis TaxID=208331 RepID=A0ABU7EZ55_9TELE|nr:hypothetical protein [Characodon lateralis]